MKKYICKIGSPEIPKGTIAEWDVVNQCYSLYNEKFQVDSVRIVIDDLGDWQVEGNSCWEEVKEEMIEFTAEQIQFIAQECYNQCLVVECGEGECAEAIATRFPNLVGRIEDVKEETKEEENPTRWKPKMGQPFYCLDESGFVEEDEWDGTLGDQRKWDIGNCFQTKQDARDEAKRRESIANAWRPVDYGYIYIWNKSSGNVIELHMRNYPSYQSLLRCWRYDIYIGAVHPTEELCKQWGETYAKYFLPKTE